MKLVDLRPVPCAIALHVIPKESFDEGTQKYFQEQKTVQIYGFGLGVRLCSPEVN